MEGSSDLAASPWPALAGLLRQLQDGLTQQLLQAFYEDWDAKGGRPCRALRQQAITCLQASPVPWPDLLLAAEALQEVCWEKLHTGPWMDVDVAWRDAYALFTVLAVLASLAQPPQQQQLQQPPSQQQRLAEAMRRLDLAAMMGGPRFRCWVDRLLTAVDERLLSLAGGSSGSLAAQAAAAAQPPGKRKLGSSSSPGAAAAAAAEEEPGPDSKSRRVERDGGAAQDQAVAAGSSPEGADQQQPAAEQPVPLPPGSLSPASAVIPVEQAPSLEHFMLNFMLAEGGPVPVVLRGVMDAWPAMTRWQDPAYLSQVAGRRTVPVEVGSHYLAEGWGTQLMTLDAFLAAIDTPGAAAPAQHQQQGQPEGGGLLYLAQHQLFEQVPALAGDILTPDYCALGETGAVSSVNAWFGPAGTVTPLHQDPQHNLLAQVVGTKYVRLYDPALTQQLHPHATGMHTNTSQVDVERVDAARFPDFAALPFTDVILQPGDMLYMPPRWWHFVKALSRSFSVSFWW